jgi:hypothetical protein
MKIVRMMNSVPVRASQALTGSRQPALTARGCRAAVVPGAAS